MCLANPIYHPCSHTSVEWFHCPAKEANQDEACMSVDFLRGDATPEACPLKSCKFPGREKGWICCCCQGGPNYTGWCTMPSLRSNRACTWAGLDPSTCDHGCCKRCVKVKCKLQAHRSSNLRLTIPFAARHQLPLSTRNTFQNPANIYQAGWDSSSSSSGGSGWSSNSSSGSLNSSPPSSTDGSYTGHFGPPDVPLREFYDKYVPHGFSTGVVENPSWDTMPEPSTNGHCGAEQIPMESVMVQKKRKDKEKGNESLSKKSKSSKKSHKSK